MHYKNGREAKIGDKVITRDWANNPIAGIVGNAAAGADTCNLTIYPLHNSIVATASECLHIDDALPPKT